MGIAAGSVSAVGTLRNTEINPERPTTVTTATCLEACHSESPRALRWSEEANPHLDSRREVNDWKSVIEGQTSRAAKRFLQTNHACGVEWPGAVFDIRHRQSPPEDGVETISFGQKDRQVVASLCGDVSLYGDVNVCATQSKALIEHTGPECLEAHPRPVVRQPVRQTSSKRRQGATCIQGKEPHSPSGRTRHVCPEVSFREMR
jgi:hypothetical protein